MHFQKRDRVGSSPDEACGIRDFVASIFPHFTAFHAGYLALDLVEIIGKASDVSASKKRLVEKFADSLAIFQQGKWLEAAVSLQGLLDIYGDDGPTRYFLGWACTYQQNPPMAWDGVIALEGK